MKGRSLCVSSEVVETAEQGAISENVSQRLAKPKAKIGRIVILIETRYCVGIVERSRKMRNWKRMDSIHFERANEQACL